MQDGPLISAVNRISAGWSEVMETDELRDTIWDYLYKSQTSKTLAEIAAFAGQDPHTVHAAVDHEWFNVAHDRVSIAYASGPRRDTWK